MKIKIIDKNGFFDNLEFFRKNLGLCFNYDDIEYLKKVDESVTNETLTQKCEEVCERVFNSYKKYFEKEDLESFVVIACDDEKIYALVTFEREKDSVWYIDAVTSRIEARRKGLASLCLKKGIEKIQSNCCLHVRKDNLPAISLYRKLGFVKNDKPIFDVENSYFLVKNYEKKWEQ